MSSEERGVSATSEEIVEAKWAQEGAFWLPLFLCLHSPSSLAALFPAVAALFRASAMWMISSDHTVLLRSEGRDASSYRHPFVDSSRTVFCDIPCA